MTPRPSGVEVIWQAERGDGAMPDGEMRDQEKVSKENEKMSL